MEIGTVIRIADAIAEEFAAGADGVVVTQGSDTIQESAFALDLLVDPAWPVAVTGAMRNPSLPGHDGPANLFSAVSVTANPAIAGQGVVVVMDDMIHAARHVHKAHTTRVGAFSSDPILLGQLAEGRLILHARLSPQPRIDRQKAAQPANIALLQASMGDQGELTDAIPACGYQGVVIEGMGGGHVHPAMADRLEQLAQRMPVVFASRTRGGTTLESTYAYAGGEMDLIGRGLIRAGWLHALKARILLSLLLGQGADMKEIRSFFTAFDGG
jgi:L-asparaginase